MAVYFRFAEIALPVPDSSDKGAPLRMRGLSDGFWKQPLTQANGIPSPSDLFTSEAPPCQWKYSRLTGHVSRKDSLLNHFTITWFRQASFNLEGPGRGGN